MHDYNILLLVYNGDIVPSTWFENFLGYRQGVSISLKYKTRRQWNVVDESLICKTSKIMA